MSISTTRINIHVIYIFHVYDKNVKNSQDVDSIDLLWINRHQQLIQLSIYIENYIKLVSLNCTCIIARFMFSSH